MNQLDFKGRTAIVTGGMQGIGAAIVKRLEASGAKVRIWDLDAPEKVDVADPGSVERATARAVADLGKIDVLVNNAGIARDGTLHKMSFEDWNEVMRINLGGCFNMAKATFPGMRERGWGRIVNIGSVNGQAGQYGQVNYAAAKSGIHGFTKALAQEGAKFGVTVNAIAPGYIDTDMVAAVPQPVLDKIISGIPVGRLGHADEIARGVAFFVSENSTFVTGSPMSINGGQHMY